MYFIVMSNKYLDFLFRIVAYIYPYHYGIRIIGYIL